MKKLQLKNRSQGKAYAYAYGRKKKLEMIASEVHKLCRKGVSEKKALAMVMKKYGEYCPYSEGGTSFSDSGADSGASMEPVQDTADRETYVESTEVVTDSPLMTSTYADLAESFSSGEITEEDAMRLYEQQLDSTIDLSSVDPATDTEEYLAPTTDYVAPSMESGGAMMEADTMSGQLGFSCYKNPNYENFTEEDSLGGIFDDILARGQQVITKGQSAVVQSTKKNFLETLNDPQVRATTTAFVDDQIKQQKDKIVLAGAFLGGYMLFSVFNLLKGLRS